jgi:ribosome-binding factor A
MKAYSRADRVAGLIQKVLADLLQKQIHDPRLASTTITGVKMSADLKSAKIYFACHGGKTGKQDAIEGFRRAHGFVKRMLAQQLGLRYMPELQFLYDESLDYAARIEKVLKTLNIEDGPNHSATDD